VPLHLSAFQSLSECSPFCLKDSLRGDDHLQLTSSAPASAGISCTPHPKIFNYTSIPIPITLYYICLDFATD
jgi:hypothetical protein